MPEAPSPTPDDHAGPRPGSGPDAALDDPAAVCLPPLRVHHLMLWMAVASVVFAVLFAVLRRRPDLATPPEFMTVVWFLPASAELTAMLVVLAAARRSGRRLLPPDWAPGHGLLLLSSFSLLLVLWIWMSAAYFGWPLFLVENAHELLGGLAAFCGGGWLAWRGRFRWPWRAVLCSMAFEPPIRWVLYRALVRSLGFDYQGWMTAYFASYLIPMAVTLLLLIAGVADDRRRQAARHWTHWVAVACALLYFAIALGWAGFYNWAPPAAP